MSDVAIPPRQWNEFLEAFTQRHRGALVQMEIYDRETGEDVESPYAPLERVELDTEDAGNPRINVTTDSDHKLIKHILFRPSHVTLHLTAGGTDEWLSIQSLNTSTTVRLV
jgi:Family of unknown function (DUF5335)